MQIKNIDFSAVCIHIITFDLNNETWGKKNLGY